MKEEKKRHPSMDRLLEAASTVGCIGPAEIARTLIESDQTLTNWSKRGVSNKGAIKAQKIMGISSGWIESGIGPMFIVDGGRGVSDLSADVKKLPHVKKPTYKSNHIFAKIAARESDLPYVHSIDTKHGPSSETTTTYGYVSSDTNLVRAPRIEWARLGADLFKEANDFEEHELLDYVPIGRPGTHTKLVPVIDDSLAPRLNVGDLVAIDPDNVKPERDQVALFKSHTDGQFFLRRYRPLAPPEFEAVDSRGVALDSKRHELEIIGVRCGVVLHDI